MRDARRERPELYSTCMLDEHRADGCMRGREVSMRNRLLSNLYRFAMETYGILLYRVYLEHVDGRRVMVLMLVTCSGLSCDRSSDHMHDCTVGSYAKVSAAEC